MKRRLYVRKDDVSKIVQQLGRKQVKNNLFVNIAVEPYHGKKYGKETTAVIVVG